MLTTTNSDGTWSCRDVDLKKGVSSGVYGALCKLRDYEARGFEPDDLDVVIENVHIGSVEDGYTVFGVWNNYCIAIKNIDSYAVMRIGKDGFDIIWRKYFNSRTEAEKFFSECAASDTIMTTEYWRR